MSYVGYMRVEPISNNKTCEKHPHALWESHCSACMVENILEKRESEQQRKAMEEQRKWVQAKVTLGEKAQRQEPVDLNSYEEQKILRAKALELACSLYNTSFYEKNSSIVEVAQRFYTYITKGE